MFDIVALLSAPPTCKVVRDVSERLRCLTQHAAMVDMRYVLGRSDISYLSLRLCEPESGASRASQPLSSGCCSLRRPPAAPLDLRSGCRDSVVSSNVNVASIAATTSFLCSDQAGPPSAGSSWRMAWPTVGHYHEAQGSESAPPPFFLFVHLYRRGWPRASLMALEVQCLAA
jgi:hypothetical protein